MKKNRNLEYYMDLSYPIEIIRIPDDDGGGYSASIPQLGKNAFLGDGETVEEALRNLEAVKQMWFEEYLRRGTPIPEPESEEKEEYSGRFVVRIPKSLHRILSRQAKAEECSLNQYVGHLLSSQYILEGFDAFVQRWNDRLVQHLEEMRRIQYTFASSEAPSWKRPHIYLHKKQTYTDAA